MQKLIYIRHGESTGNANDIFAEYDAELTEKGRRQAEQSASKLGETPDVIIASPQARTFETSQIIASELSFTGDLILNELCVEREYGQLIGTPFIHNSDDIDIATAQIETLKELFHRAQKFYMYLQSLEVPTVLVVAHGGFGRALTRVIDGLAFDAPVRPMQNAEPIVLIDSA